MEECVHMEKEQEFSSQTEIALVSGCVSWSLFHGAAVMPQEFVHEFSLYSPQTVCIIYLLKERLLKRDFTFNKILGLFHPFLS